MAKSYPARNIKELIQILREVDQVCPVLRLMLEFEARTGLRYSDSSQVKFSDVMINGTIKDKFEVVMSKPYQKRLSKNIPDSVAKKLSTIEIKISDELKEIILELNRLNAQSDLLFNSQARHLKNKNKPITIQYANRVLKTVAVKLSLPYGLSTHSMRKSFAMMILEAGGSIYDVKKRLGHADLKSTEYYLGTFIDSSQDIMANISFSVDE